MISEKKEINYNELDSEYKRIFELFNKKFKLKNCLKYIDRDTENFGFILNEIERNENNESMLKIIFEEFFCFDKKDYYKFKNDKIYLCIDLVEYLYDLKIKKVRNYIYFESLICLIKE